MQVDKAPRHNDAHRARHAERDPATGDVDVARFGELGLIDQAPDGAVSVPFDAVEIRVPLARVA